MNVRFPSRRRVGIEIEYLSEQSHRAVANSLKRNIDGIIISAVGNCESDDEDYEGWQIKTDGSLSEGDADDDYYECTNCGMSSCECGEELYELAEQPESRCWGVEIVTPPMDISNAISRHTLHRVLKIVSSSGHVDRSCGLHVHVSAYDLDFEHKNRLVLLWDRAGFVLNTYVPPSRRGNSYCHFGSSEYDKYYSLSFRPLESYGTVEFRLHHGTLEFDKIINWALLCRSMVDWARRSRKPIKGHKSKGRSLVIGAIPNKVYEKHGNAWYAKGSTLLPKKHVSGRGYFTPKPEIDTLGGVVHPMKKLCRLLGINGESSAFLCSRYDHAVNNFGPCDRIGNLTEHSEDNDVEEVEQVTQTMSYEAQQAEREAQQEQEAIIASLNSLRLAREMLSHPPLNTDAVTYSMPAYPWPDVEWPDINVNIEEDLPCAE